MSNVPPRFQSIDQLHFEEIKQVVEENLKRNQEKKYVLVQDKRSRQLKERNSLRTEAINNPNREDYWGRKMVACGLDPSDEKLQFPKKYEYLDNDHSVEVSKYEETYPPGFITLLANAWEYDVYINKATEIKAQLITNNGEGITIRVEPFTHLEVKHSEEANKLLNSFMKEADRKLLLQYLDNVLAFTRLYSKLNDAIVQRSIFGRGGALIRRLDAAMMKKNTMFGKAGLIEGSPVFINPLSTPAMGRVLVDPSSWEVSRLWYNDAIFGKEPGTDKEKPGDWIKAEDMIYLVNKNYHMLPSRYHYGFSDLTPLMPLSETMRQIYTEVLTEANLNLVLPSIMFTFDDLDEKSIQRFVDNYRAGGVMGRNTAVGFQKIDFAPNLEQILHELDYIKKMLNYGVGIPPIFSGSEELTNRSIADRIAEVWTMTDLLPIRKQFSTAIYDQFFVPTIKNWIDHEKGDLEINDFIASKIRIITEFPKLDFSDVLQKAQALEIFKKNYITTLGETRKLALLPPYPDDMVDAMIEVEKKLQEQPDFAEQLLQFLKGQGMVEQTFQEEDKQAEIDNNPTLTPEQKDAITKQNELRNNLDKESNKVVKKLAEKRF